MNRLAFRLLLWMHNTGEIPTILLFDTYNRRVLFLTIIFSDVAQVDKLKEQQQHARKARSNLWQYGDIPDEEDDFRR
jgi:hypothetical protein